MEYREETLIIDFNAVYERQDQWDTYWDADNRRVYTVGSAFDGSHCGWRDFSDSEWSNVAGDVPNEPVKTYRLTSDAVGFGIIKEV